MKPTLGQVFAFSLFGLMATLALLFTVVFRASSESIAESSGRLRDQAAREVGTRVTGFLAMAPARVEQFQSEVAGGLVEPRDPVALEAALFALLLSDENLGELSLTYAEKTGFDANGEILLAEGPRGELSVTREHTAGADRFWSRHVRRVDGIFSSDRREFRAGQPLAEQPPVAEHPRKIEDPTEHLTFRTPASRDFQGRTIPSDLHWSQLDAELPIASRRAEVSVQRTVVDTAGRFLGVFRVGLLTRELDQAVRLRMAPAGQADPHRIFICDDQARLITRLSPEDRLQEFEDDLRIEPAHLPVEVAAALGSPMLDAVTKATPAVSGQFRLNGQDYFATFRALPGTQEWVVGIVVPRAFYLGKLAGIRNRLLAISLGIVVLVIVAGGLILRAVKRAQARIVEESLKMKRFEFTPGNTGSSFQDVSEILESLEQAKTAMRAMGKYVPVDLVRQLYEAKSEPVLGGAETKIAIMFTDIKDFTRLSEELAPDALATALGRYLEVMTRIIQHETHGTIDKYIGDAIMTFWNAPQPVNDPIGMACRAALACRDAGRGLALSSDGRTLPPFETRFGLHYGSALVGHFGAPERMNYTAIGDAINLAARLEGLNKFYGTTIIASESVVESAAAHFDFRLLDWVAVKGKSASVKIYELLGEKGAGNPCADAAVVAAYEKAFAAYVVRDFERAHLLLALQPQDAPSAVLRERCERLRREPPPEDWRGVHVFHSK